MFYSNVRPPRENKMESNGRVESSQNQKCEIKKNHSTKHHENHEVTAKINVQELNINFLEITGFSNRQYDVICQQRF